MKTYILPTYPYLVDMVSKTKQPGLYNALLLVVMLLPSLTLFSCGGGGSGSGGSGGSGSETAAAAPAPLSDNIYLWTTTSQYNGNLGGIEGANNKCAGDDAKIAALPTGEFTYTHQAVLAGSESHSSSIIPSTDTREVQRPDSTKIADNYQAFAGSTNAVDASVTSNNIEYWTGLDYSVGDATFALSNHCNNWGVSSGTGAVGRSIDIDGDRLGNYIPACNTPQYLLCLSH